MRRVDGDEGLRAPAVGARVEDVVGEGVQGLAVQDLRGDIGLAVFYGYQFVKHIADLRGDARIGKFGRGDMIGGYENAAPVGNIGDGLACLYGRPLVKGRYGKNIAVAGGGEGVILEFRRRLFECLLHFLDGDRAEL